MTNWKSARLHGEVIFQPLSARLQDGVRLIQRSLARHRHSSPCGAACPSGGRDVGFTMFRICNTNELAPAYYTGSP